MDDPEAYIFLLLYNLPSKLPCERMKQKKKVLWDVALAAGSVRMKAHRSF
ncbi:MAG: hypothetical protein WCF57_13420 [Pyrinomonadaceae bacterium]